MTCLKCTSLWYDAVRPGGREATARRAHLVSGAAEALGAAHQAEGTDTGGGGQEAHRSVPQGEASAHEEDGCK